MQVDREQALDTALGQITVGAGATLAALQAAARRAGQDATLDFATLADGFLGPSDDPDLYHGSVSWRIETRTRPLPRRERLDHLQFRPTPVQRRGR